MKIETSSLNGLTFIEIENNANMKVVLSTFGAAIYSISIDGEFMTSSEMDKTVWSMSPSYSGKTVGRIAGRIKDGILVYKGNKYQLDKNECNKTCHHGGDGLFAFSTYKMDTHLEEDGVYVDFYKIDDNSKFPGKLTFRVRYIIPHNDTFIRIEHMATSDVCTPVNFTSHTYFSLNEDNIEDVKIRINSEEVESYDEDLIAIGLRGVPEHLDFRKGKALKDVLENEEYKSPRLLGLDHAFKFSFNDGKKPAMSLTGKKYKMRLVTSLPAVQLYSFNFPNEEVMMTNGLFGRIHGAMAVEPMYVPGDYESMTVSPSEPKRNFIEYHFERV